MNRNNIVVIGYPKSGTTWLSRLVAELVNCPLKGDWGFDHINALYAEGKDRASNHTVYKSHHTAHQLKAASSLPIYKKIYVIRDPRDVVVSGINYFDFNSLKKARLSKIGLQKLQDFFVSEISIEEKKRRMMKAVLEGDKKLNQWLETPWKSHYSAYLTTNALIIRYEDMLENTEEICRQIAAYLEISISENHLKQSVANQEFSKKKKEAIENDHPAKALLRSGQSGEWKTVLSKEDLKKFKLHLSHSQNFYVF